ncbi:MAG: hypothetical protein DHS20C15_33470 [Planctomycetota bacterium]|nr:MAG: hypothetical protein DHS20C15_33470 [Planctomycetota bacterium]
MSWLWWFALPGCLMWAGILTAAALTALRVPKLAQLSPTRPKRWPTLAVIVPCRNEAANVEAAARSLMAVDYPRLELVLVNDRSTDDTGAIIDRLAAEDARVRVVHIDTLPTGWLGKNHALSRGVASTEAEWLLFTDGDVHFHAEALRRAISYTLQHDADHLALFPDVHTHDSPALDLTLSAFGRYFAVGQRVWSVSDPNSSASVGVGAFNLVRADALQDAGGLEAFPLDVADDLALGLALKRSGARSLVAGGQGLIGLEWYANYAEMARGLEKNSFAPLEFSLARLALLVGPLLVVELSPFVALCAIGSNAVVFGAGLAAALGACILDLGMAAWTKRPRWTALFVPVGGVLMAAIFLRAGLIGHKQGGLVWRDSFYPKESIIGRQLVTWP